jgi:hypothetical protein
MGMNYDEARQLLKLAELSNEAADSIADGIARLLCGRLRKVRNGTVLRALKKELANYDMTTGRWKS